MIAVYAATGLHRRETLATLPTFEEAKAYVEALGVIYMEDDSDHRDCADAFLADGRVIAIQPTDFALTATYGEDHGL